MNLGERILNARKKKGLSQEQLGEKVNVTRQTISNWELGETAPNPEQLKLLSKELNISIDELLDNDVKSILVEKVSNTEKLAGLVLRVAKWIGVCFIIMLVVDFVSLIIFSFNKDSLEVKKSEGIALQCTLNENDYLIEVDNRNLKHISINSLEDYLTIELKLKKRLLRSVNVEYFDSKDNLMVQVSDFFSNLYFSYLKNKSTYESLINKLKKENYIKDIYYYPNT